MSQTATQDEDILIISDDTTTGDSDIFIEENVDTTPSDNQESAIKLSIPTFTGTDDVADTEKMIIADENDVITSETSVDLGTSFESNSENPQISDSSEVQASFDTPVEKSQESLVTATSNEFDFSNLNNDESVSQETPSLSEVKIEDTFVAPEVKVSPIEEETMSDDGTNLNAILAGTIAKLVKRQEVIANDKAAKTSQVQDLKAQIANLEEEVSLHESEIEVLDMEDDKISKNTAQLEKMKLGDDEVTREHNAKRVAKK